MSNSIYSDSKWLKERLYFQWQIIRRHPEYQKFCEDYCKYFTKDEFPSLDDSRLPDDTAKKKAENLRNRLGLNNVYHYKADIPKEYMLDWPIFEQDRAVECELKKIKKDPERDFTPIWDDHYIKVKIDLNKNDTEIKNQIIELINWGRKIMSKPLGKKKQRIKHDDYIVFKVWDLNNAGKSWKEIIKEIWPKEYTKEFGGDDADLMEGKIFKKLCNDQTFKKKHGDKWLEKAYEQTYGERNMGGKVTLFNRIQDNIKKMNRLLEQIKLLINNKP